MVLRRVSELNICDQLLIMLFSFCPQPEASIISGTFIPAALICDMALI